MDSPLKKPRVRGTAGPPADAPDGGYAWFIVLACFTVFGLTLGVIKSFGIFYIEIQNYFNTTATAASWITSIIVAAFHIASPLASALSARFSHRSVVIIGGLISSVGVIIGSFSRNLLELYLTVGFLNGLGYALAWTPAVTMVGLYFDRRRPVANALSSSGECVFTFAFMLLSQWLNDSYSWRGALLILGGLQLNLCVCGALLRPLTTSEDFKNKKEVRADEDEQMLQNNSQSLHQVDKKTFKSRIIPYVDYTLIANADFMMYAIFGMIAALGFFTPSLFLVKFARSRGIEEYQSAALMSILSILDLVGRVIFGWVANLRIIKTVHQLIISTILLGAVLLLCPLASSFVELAVLSAAIGLMFGAAGVAINITVLAEVVGVQRLGNALGFSMLIRSFGGLLGPPIAGFFIDQTDDYGAAFLIAGAAPIIASFFLILLEVKTQRSSSNKLWKRKAKTAPSHTAEEEAEMARR